MRLCRFGTEAKPRVGFYDDSRIVPLREAAKAAGLATPDGDNLVEHLASDAVKKLHARLDEFTALAIEPKNLLVPISKPSKIFLLAGNYADHVRESGETARERAETFPYVFMKPPTTLAHPGQTIRRPRAAPDAVDWELELAVVIGRTAKNVSEADALSHVAGYTVLNDISQRRFRPNPDRKKRDRDAFFDWLHGKWFDTFCPMGPCLASAESIPDPQTLRMTLTVNDAVKQKASTAQQIFPVAAVIAFISQMVTLEPGDIISTGTPAGVGSTTGTFLEPGDMMTAWIERIGTLTTPVEDER